LFCDAIVWPNNFNVFSVIIHTHENQADILTQAMTALTHSFTPDLRSSDQHTEYQLNSGSPNRQPQNIYLQQALVHTGQSTVIDASHILHDTVVTEDNGNQPQPITITGIQGNQTHTIHLPWSLASQLITKTLNNMTTAK
jgi:hypothetical protein